MLPDSGTVIVFVARSCDCPATSAYGPVGKADDCKMAADCDLADVGIVIVLESKATAAVRANSLPSTVAPVVTVMEARARMFPFMTEVVPRVAELPTCQKMLAALAPPLRITWR